MRVPEAGSIEAIFVLPAQRLISLAYLFMSMLPVLAAPPLALPLISKVASTRWSWTSPPEAVAETPTTAVTGSPAWMLDVTSPSAETPVKVPVPVRGPVVVVVVVVLEQDMPVVELKPMLEVQPAGSVPPVLPPIVVSQTPREMGPK